MVGVFEDVATDPRFLRIGAVNADEMAAAVRSASIRYSNPLQGGFAGRIVSESGDDLILGLSRFHVRRSPAAHELFHLSRDLRGIQTLRMDKIPDKNDACVEWHCGIQGKELRRQGQVNRFVVATMLNNG